LGKEIPTVNSGDIDFSDMSVEEIDKFTQLYTSKIEKIQVLDRRYACVEKALGYLLESRNSLRLMDKITYVRCSIGIIIDICSLDQRQIELQECFVLYGICKQTT
jgi:hypothetical protein